MCSRIGCVAFLVGVFAAPAGAIVTEDTPTSEADPTTAIGLNWDYVYHYKGSSAVAVDPYWLLTAAHVADDAPSWNMTLGATTYTEQEVVEHKPSADPDHSTTADLALVRLDRALPGHYEIYTGAFPAPAALVGFGYAGTVATDGESYAWTSGTEGTKRWGTNKVDDETTITYDGLVLGFSTNTDATTYEAGVAVHDSGGGLFVQDADDGDVWKLGGTITTVFGTEGAFTGSGAVEVGAYDTWITNTVPEPATLILLAGGSAGLILRRRRKSTAA
ncbi:MAG: trypsin-like serine protease [Phycisphaerae bacterium]|nr:trypsin-like serine protease [Phycisphaerae bacterium]